MTLTIRPRLKQFIAENFGLIIFAFGAMIATPMLPKDNYLQLGFTIAVVVLFFTMITQYMILTAKKWQITDDSITIYQGVFSKKRDFIELYRIVDYKEEQTLIQHLLGIKTVMVLSTDRTDPILKITGVPNSLQLIAHLRKIVESCKKERNIYEITNH